MVEHRLVIDPGHGGRSAGVVYGDVVEKDAALEMALTLKHVLVHELEFPFDIHMTRTGDRDVRWSERLVPATLSVAVHFDIPHGGMPIYYQQGRCESYFIAEYLRLFTNKRNPVWSTREAVHTGRKLYIDDARHPFVLWEADTIDHVKLGEDGREYRLALARPMAQAIVNAFYMLMHGL